MYDLKSRFHSSLSNRTSYTSSSSQTSSILKSKRSSVFIPSLDGDLPASEEALENLGILCINCQETIPEFQIEKHSRCCTTVNETLHRIDVDTLSSIKLRLQKLRTFLEFIQTSSDSDPADKNILVILIRNLDGLISTSSPDNKPTVQRSIESLTAMLNNFRASTSHRIYSERTLSLAQEMGKFLEDQQIAARVQEIEKLKNEIDTYKDKAKALEFSITRRVPKAQNWLQKINDISSDVASSNCESEFSDMNSDSQSLCGEIDDIEAEDFKYLQDTKDQQRNFYAICLNSKLNFSSKHAAQRVPIFELFSKAKAQKVPADKWAEFIRSELIQASSIRPLSIRTSRRSQPRNVPARFRYFETIQEEEVHCADE